MAKRKSSENQLKQLKPFEKGRSGPEVIENARKGGIASGKARKEKADIRKALEKLLSMQTTGKLKEMMEALGYDAEDMSNADALVCSVYAAGVQGDLKAADMIFQYGFQASEDERKTKESAARIAAMKQNIGETQITSSDGNDGDVVIYLPKIEEEEEEKEEEEKE